MKSMKNILTPVLTLILLLPGVFVHAQYNFSDTSVVNRLKHDIYILADEDMEGREAGTEGEKKAADFIQSEMVEIGLESVFGDSYLQEFQFVSDYVYGENNFLYVGHQAFTSVEDFFVMPHSGNDSITAKGIYVGSGLENDIIFEEAADSSEFVGKVFFIEYYMPPEIEAPENHNQDLFIQKKIATAKEKGAAAIVFINTYEEKEDPEIRLTSEVPRESFPVIFAKSDIFEFFEQSEMYGDIVIKTELIKESHTSYNVAGYINNYAESTIVIGGHYDHLGYGGPTSRDYQQGAVHYGADDNASGTAAVLEAARYFSNSTSNHYNYLFIAFGAEEKGLLGSRHFVDSDAYDLSKVNFMFNFDMIGRLEDHRLVLIGTGTSTAWEEIIDNNKPDHFNIVKVESGFGGSDHSSFYLKDIPVIFFYTGNHQDYHTSTDTPDKLNYEGISEIIGFTYDMISYTEQLDKLEFKTTPVPKSRRRRSDMVTLGIMPDHAFDGKGVRVQAVIDDRPAQKAGLEAGDVIIAIDDSEVNEIHSYMKTLENLKKGQQIKVTILREEEEKVIDLEL